MKQSIHIMLVIFLGFMVGVGHGFSQSGPNGVKSWKGKISYKLEHRDDVFESSVTFMGLKGLKGDTFEKVSFEGNVTFNYSTNRQLYVAKGNVTYDVSIIYMAKLGEAMVVHLTSGKGTEKVQPIGEINYLRINPSSGTYSLSIMPGISDEEVDAFGVYVETVSEMKVTRALLNKMESLDRPILFPEFLKTMFPDSVKEPGRENISAEAFEQAMGADSGTLKGSVKDEKGGVFSWDLHAVR